MSEVLKATLEYVQARIQTALVELAADDLPAALAEIDSAANRLNSTIEGLRA